jgi:hypothetical protein
MCDAVGEAGIVDRPVMPTGAQGAAVHGPALAEQPLVGRLRLFRIIAHGLYLSKIRYQCVNRDATPSGGLTELVA